MASSTGKIKQVKRPPKDGSKPAGAAGEKNEEEEDEDEDDDTGGLDTLDGLIG